LQGAAPSYDLSIARDRTIGIMIGNVVVYLVFTRAWPVTVAARVDAGIAALRQQWQRLASLPDAVARRAQAASAMAQCDALEQDLALVHYEPSWVRPDAQWIAERRSTLARLGALEGPMFLLAERRPGDVAIDDWLKRFMGGLPPETRTGSEGVSEASGGAALSAARDPALPVAPHATLPDATTVDDTRTALLRLADARLTQLEHTASNDAAKELSTHAPA
jgi:multidrug resistance protein MdtO